MTARTSTKKSAKKAPAKPRQKRNGRPTEPTLKSLALAKLRLDGDTQPRAEIDKEVVKDYFEAYEDKKKLPPLTVFYDGADHWLADGFHRARAAKKAGRKMIQCEVYKGKLENARWHSYSANQTHGHRRTNADKRKCVIAALKHPSGKGRSDRVIAEHCGVGHSFVSRLRKELSTVDSSPAQTKGKDGKVRKRKSRRDNPRATQSASARDDGSNADIAPRDDDQLGDDDGDTGNIDVANGGNGDCADAVTDATVLNADSDDTTDRTSGVELEQLQDAYDNHVVPLVDAATEPVREQFYAWLKTQIT